jgi:hypothetical protein
VDGYLEGVLSPKTVRERDAALLSESKDLEAKIADLDWKAMQGPRSLQDFLERLDSAYSLYETGTDDERRR